MRRIEKQSIELDRLIEEFRSRLRMELQACAAGGNALLFHSVAFRPDDWPTSVEHKATDQLVADANAIIELHQLIGLDPAGSLADRFVDECRQHSDVSEANRLGVRRRAERLLLEL